MNPGRRIGVFLLVLAIVLAGCGGTGGNPTATTNPSTDPATTTAALSTDTPTQTTTASIAIDELPPGVTADGLTDVDAFLTATEETQLQDGYAGTLVISNSGAVDSTVEIRGEYGADGTYSIARTTKTALGDDSTALWSNGSRTFLKQSVGGDPVYSAVDAGYYRSQTGLFAVLSNYVRFGDFVLNGTVDHEGEEVLRLSASRARPDAATPPSFPTADQITNFNGTLLVDQSGKILKANVSYRARTETPGEYQTVNLSYRPTAGTVGSVPRPNWVSTATDEVTMADLTIELQGEVVVVHHEGGDPIPAGAAVSIVTTNETGKSSGFVAQFTTGLDPGETAFIFRTDPDAREGTVSIDSTPEGDVVSLEGTVRVSIGMPDGEIVEIWDEGRNASVFAWSVERVPA